MNHAPFIRTPGDVAAVLPARAWRHQTERFFVLALRPNGLLIAMQCVARGGVDCCPVDPREVFRFALVRRASGIVVAHNHPSGDPTPSRQDTHLTERLAAGAGYLGLRVLDHLIIARGGGRYSFAEHDRLPRVSEGAAS